MPGGNPARGATCRSGRLAPTNKEVHLKFRSTYTHFRQCAAFTNGCTSYFTYESRSKEFDPEQALKRGWRLDYGEWVCGEPHGKGASVATVAHYIELNDTRFYPGDVVLDAYGRIFRLQRYNGQHFVNERDRYYWIAFGTTASWPVDAAPTGSQEDPKAPFTRARIVPIGESRACTNP